METQSNAEELETCQIGKCLFVNLINTIDSRGKVVIEPWPCGRSFKDSTCSTALIATRRSYIIEQEEETIGRISISLEWNDHVRGPRVRLVHAVLCTWHCARNGTAVRLDVVSMRATTRFEVCHVCVCPTVSSVGRPLFPVVHGHAVSQRNVHSTAKSYLRNAIYARACTNDTDNRTANLCFLLFFHGSTSTGKRTAL